MSSELLELGCLLLLLGAPQGDSEFGDLIEDSEAVVPADAVSFTLLQEQLHSVLDTLSEREAGVVAMRFGLTDGQPKTLDEIGKVYGVTRERIRQIESKTMSKLRHPSRSQSLRDYLDENCKFDLPEDLVKNEQEIVKHSFIHEKAHKDEPHDDHKHGHDHSDIKLTKEEEEDILDISKRRVKLALVLNQIGEDYKIQVTTQELQQELQKQMSMYPGQEKQIRDYYQKNPSEITRLRGPIYEDKIVELVKSKAKVTVKEVNKKELEELVKDLSSNLKSKSSAKSAKSVDDKSKKDTKSEDKSKSTKKISKK